MTETSDRSVPDLEAMARVVRRDVLTMIHAAGGGHAGGALSAADLVTALYFKVLRVDPSEPRWPSRDRFILSKGHAAPVLYACLARRGYFPVEELSTYRKLGSRLAGHPDMQKTLGVDMTSGSLGQGLSIASGIAMAGRLRENSYKVYVLMSDGEMDEGQVWEAAMAIAHHRIDNVVAIVDVNGFQVDGPTSNVMSLDALADKWRAFGWNVLQIDGNDMRDILGAFDSAREPAHAPSVIIAHTIKGKGVSFMEGDNKWHSMPIGANDLANALRELGG